MLHTAHRTDPRRLRGEIETALAAVAGEYRDRIEVAASAGGIVTLTGTVPSRALRRRVVALAWGVTGVQQVVNRLRVEG